MPSQLSTESTLTKTPPPLRSSTGANVCATWRAPKKVRFEHAANVGDRRCGKRAREGDSSVVEYHGRVGGCRRCRADGFWIGHVEDEGHDAWVAPRAGSAGGGVDPGCTSGKSLSDEFFADPPFAPVTRTMAPIKVCVMVF